MRIAFIGAKGLPSRSGVERVVEPLVERLTARHEVTYYCDARYTPADYTRNGLNLVRISTLPGKHAQATSLFLESAMRAVAHGGHDVVHLHSVETAFVAPLLKVRFPIVATAHGSPRRSTRTKWGPMARVLMAMTEQPFARLPEVVTSVSAVDACYFEERYGRSVLYVPNGVDPPPPSTREERESVCASLGVAPDRFALFAAGRVDPTKGCHVFLEALSQMSDAPPALVVGDLQQVPQYNGLLHARAKKLPVLFAEPIRDRSRLMALISSCAVFVFPSLTEGMSMMLLEAAACGVPLVCSDIPENSAALGDRAVFFKSGDCMDLARKMDWAIEHRQEAKRIAIETAGWVIETYAWDRIVPQYEEAYDMAVRRRST